MCWFHSIHVFIHCCHMIIVLNDYLVHSCWGLHWGSRVLQTRLIGSLEFCSLDCGWVIMLFNLCLLDAIVELHGMDEKKNVQWLSYRKVKVEFICNECFFNLRFIFCICSGGIHYITLKNKYKYMSPFSSLPLIHIFFPL